jgi:predicted cupin superfamily sugar epimerase
MVSPRDAATLIQQLELLPHPEGGHYRETYRAAELVHTPRGPRAASTAILFLLAAGEWSGWHRIRSDEAWHHHGGGGLEIYEVCPAGRTRRTRLGLNLAAGERPQHVVPAGSWFAAQPAECSAWSLVGCTVAPGFEFVDFELATPACLAAHAAQLAPLCPHWRQLCVLA